MNYDPDYNPAAYDYVYGPNGPLTGNYLYGQSLLGNPGDCAPLNIMGRGAPSQAARDYVGTNLRTNAMIEQELTYATLAGDLFEMHQQVQLKQLLVLKEELNKVMYNFFSYSRFSYY